MSEFTLRNEAVFPEGTEVAAVETLPWEVVDEGTVDEGTVTFTGLEEGVEYTAAGEVDGVWRYLKFFMSFAVEPGDGKEGPPGPEGPEGPQGPQGDEGPQGAKGDAGAAGAAGAKGAEGAQGVKGEKGDKGDTGAAGAKGEKGDTGSTGPEGKEGKAAPTADLGTVWGDQWYGGSSVVPGKESLNIIRVAIAAKSKITGIRYLVNNVANGDVRSAMFSKDGETRLANRTTKSEQPGTLIFHKVDFDTPVTVEPGEYWLCLWFASATATARSGSPLGNITTKTGVAEIPAKIVPPSAPSTAGIAAMTTY